ncbi:nitric oxide reductase NorD protein [Amorphus suaedae]
MSPAAAPATLAARNDDAVAAAVRLIGQRDALRAPFGAALDAVSRHAAPADRDAWCDAVVALVHANAGKTVLLAAWQLTREEIGSLDAARLADLIGAATETCRRAGASAATALLRQAPVALRKLPDADATTGWASRVAGIAADMPRVVEPLLAETGRILSHVDLDGFTAWVEAGRRATDGDPRKQAAFFSLEDPAAVRLLARAGREQPFDRLERQLATYATALFGLPVSLRAFEPPTDDTALPPRSNIAGGLIRLPLAFQAPPAEQNRIFYASVAHMAAHLAFSTTRFEVGRLRPLQIALVNLAEDHRVETLAARHLPGLASTWRRFHTITADTPATTDNLLARIARALADPAYEDPDWAVAKARSLVAERADRLDDPATSREFGSLLGNDFGQRRLQFNWKTYVVEPVYRDDGLGLWEFPDADAPPETIEMFSEAAKRVQADDPSEGNQSEPDESHEPAKVRPADLSDGLPLARYPEWDNRTRELRPEWTCVRDVPGSLGTPAAIERLIGAHAGVHERLVKQIRSARIGRAERLRRQPDGDVLDLDAAIDHRIRRQVGDIGDDRLFVRSHRQARDLSTLVLLDVSQSTRERIPLSTSTILDLEVASTALLGRALDSLGDRLAIRSFASDGRNDVQLTRLKEFDEPFDDAAMARLAGVRPGLSTRLGAAVRHAAGEIAQERAYRKLIAVVTDGETSDIDVRDPDYLAFDAQHAVRAARRSGTDVVCIALSTDHLDEAKRIFGAGHVFPVARIETLPTALSAIIFRLAAR